MGKGQGLQEALPGFTAKDIKGFAGFEGLGL